MNKVCSKRLDYDYDLVSGKVNRLYYQSGEPDQFIYRYDYDADNRLKKALSSTDGLNWSLEAEYKYYKHGPLSRIELGRDFKKVQGMDYAYTLQGWIKGVNASFLDPNRDIGKDGVSGTANANVRKDAFSYTIGYFDGDYKPIGGEAVRFDVKTDDSQTIAAASAYAKKGLFNGNIRFIASDNEKFDKPILMTYCYDQLNRLNKMESWQNRVTKGNFTWQRSAPETKWREDVTYDPNGNIKTYLRRDETGLLMDNLVYNYNETGGRLTNNQLASVTEQVTTATAYPDDIEAGNNSFVYDKIGNLTADVKENTIFAWSVYGKMLSATKGSVATMFGYDPQQNRFKKSTPTGSDFYIRDAQGNVLAIYQKKDNNFVWKEQHLYGSSRLGIFAPEVKIQGVYVLDVAALKQSVRTYELTNHLGNVLLTLTDKGVITSAQDYFPFGLTLASRSFTEGGSNYRYSFNGKEDDKETGLQDYGMRLYFKNLGRFPTVDPLTKCYPFYTPYQFAGNKPIVFIDLDGGEPTMPRDNTRMLPVLAVPDKTLLYKEAIMKVYAASHGNSGFKPVSKIENEVFDFINKSLNPASDRGARISPEALKEEDEIKGSVLQSLFSGDKSKENEAISKISTFSSYIYRNPIAGHLGPIAGTFLLKRMVASAIGFTKEAAQDLISTVRLEIAEIEPFRNIAIVTGKIGSTEINSIGVSGFSSPAGTAATPVERLFATKVVGHNRQHDSEVKILEDIAAKFTNNRSVKGEIRVISERTVCPSCEGVFAQFQKMFPNIKIKYMDNIKPK